mmetsp:Transcript_62252/g.133876  ORF Transcript_62252/g.133876 Transcript_62252/m.133876 type:complete len:228 (+) Transcript_62252:781-1464(+)
MPAAEDSTEDPVVVLALAVVLAAMLDVVLAAMSAAVLLSELAVVLAVVLADALAVVLVVVLATGTRDRRGFKGFRGASGVRGTTGTRVRSNTEAEEEDGEGGEEEVEDVDVATVVEVERAVDVELTVVEVVGAVHHTDVDHGSVSDGVDVVDCLRAFVASVQASLSAMAAAASARARAERSGDTPAWAALARRCGDDKGCAGAAMAPRTHSARATNLLATNIMMSAR